MLIEIKVIPNHGAASAKKITFEDFGVERQLFKIEVFDISNNSLLSNVVIDKDDIKRLAKAI
jgi:hypothetical protein